jgi:hypothetical protein
VDDGENGMANLIEKEPKNEFEVTHVAPQSTEQLGGKKPSRLYYVDWCRSIGIHVVLIEHCINSVETATGVRYVN